MLIGIDGNEANVKNRVGSGKYAIELIREFSKLKAPQFEIFLKNTPLPDLPAPSKTFKYKIFGPKKFWTQFALPIRLTFGKKPDVFFSMAHYGPRFSKIPYIVTIHDLSYLHFPELFRKEDLLQLTNWSKYSIEKSAHIIVPSKSTKDDIVKNYGVRPDKITVTYEGYNSDLFKPASKQNVQKAKQKYKIAGEYLIFIGTLQPRKNIVRLIEAFSKMADKKISLVVVGKKGWIYDEILLKSKELNIEKRVIFTDFVPDEDLSGLISGAKVYVNPSLWEGFGIPVIEAQACGTPVAVSNTSSLPEIVGDSAVLFDPENTNSIASRIEKVIVSEKLSKDLVQKGFKNIERFSWDKCARETLAVLQKFASK